MKYIILGHENPDVDSIVSGYLLEKVMTKKGYEAKFVITDKEVHKESLDICKKYKVDVDKYMSSEELDKEAKYILIDHHDRVVPGEVVAIIDHHPTVNDYSNLKYYRNEKSSSVAIMIAKECIKELNKHDVELACLATFVDTASFHSTKTNKADISWINEMCTKYDFEYDDLYREGLCLTDLTDVNDIAYNGMKKHEFNGMNIYSSYIQVASLSKSEHIVKEILDNLKEHVKKENIDLFVFIVYDMSDFYTKVYEITDDIKENEYFLYASRGNTIIPDIFKRLKNK